MCNTEHPKYEIETLKKRKIIITRRSPTKSKEQNTTPKQMGRGSYHASNINSYFFQTKINNEK